MPMKPHLQKGGRWNGTGFCFSNKQRRTRSDKTTILYEHDEYACMFTLHLDGDIILLQVRLHLRSGSRTMNGSRVKVGIISDLQPGLNSFLQVEIISTGKPVE